MKSKLFFFILFSLFILVNESCTTKAQQNVSNKIPLYNENKKINIELENGKADLTFYKQHLNTVSLVFDTEGYNHIKASLLSNGNVRFNIVGFENESDGPYGDELNLPLNKSGVYTINLGPNLMAENYTKDIIKVTVHVDLSNE